MAVYTPAAGPVTLTPGDVTRVFNSSSTGTGLTFCLTANIAGRSAQSLNLSAQGASVTAVTVTLQQSADGGTTWETAPNGSALALIASSTGAPVIISVVPGLLYRINATTVTGGTAQVYAATT